jgi:predicted nucleotidyltransferase
MEMAKKTEKANNGKEAEQPVYVPQMPTIPPVKNAYGAAIPAGTQSAEQKQVKLDPEKLKTQFEPFKKAILKKYPFTMALGIVPPQAMPLFEEDEALPKEIVDANPLLVLMTIPEDEYKNVPKIKPEVIKMLKEVEPNSWLLIKTPVDLWNYGLDSRFEFLDAISASFPLFDNGFLGALRVANIHKSLVLRKFDKYVASYVIAGSLVRGTAGKDSDVDVFVIIDDTDVKRMPRLELLEKLRGMIYDYIREATALAGVTNRLEVQVYLLTDFWQSVKDAHPVHFTFIRDGIPLYDRGTFIPWKLLLRMGKIKPSPEAIELYMKQGEQTDEFVKRRLLDAMVDVFWGMTTPTQAIMMLAGEAPPVPKVLVEEVRKVLVEREKVMKPEMLKPLDKIIGLYKQYEYGKLKEIPGKEIDELLVENKKYNEALKEIQKELETKMQGKTAEEIYGNVFTLLKTILGNHSQEELVKAFDTQLVKKGKVQPRFSHVLKELISVKGKIKSGKLNQKEVEKAKADAIELVNSLVEYAQRADLVKAEKGTIQIIYNGNRKAELVLLGENNFLIEGQAIKKLTADGLADTTQQEFEKILNEQKGALHTQVSSELFAALQKALGPFTIVL